MRNYFEFLMKQLLSINDYDCINEEIKVSDFETAHIKLEFRKILDELAVHIVNNNFENNVLIEAIMELARIERIIIVFYYICNMELSEIAFLLETDINSVYVQKCTAIKHLKEILKYGDNG